MWETIDSSIFPLNCGQKNMALTSRMKVPGGWLVRSILEGSYNADVRMTQTFIADERHEWVLEKKE